MKRKIQSHNFGQPQVSNPYTDLDFEDLESRVMLAGDVTAAFSDGTLTLTGDTAANQVHVLRFFDTIEVVATDGTSINGGAGIDSISLSQLENLSVDLGTGADVLSVNTFGSAPMRLSGDLDINMSAGADLVALGVRIGSQSGNLNDLVVEGEANISLGVGNDTLWMEDVEIGSGMDTTVLNLLAEDGNDNMTNLNVTLNGAAIIDLGDGASNSYNGVNLDVNFDLRLRGGDGFDLMLLNNVNVGTVQDPVTQETLNLTLFNGDDLVRLEGPLNVQDRLRVVGGQGTDTVENVALATTQNGPLEINVEITT